MALGWPQASSSLDAEVAAEPDPSGAEHLENGGDDLVVVIGHVAHGAHQLEQGQALRLGLLELDRQLDRKRRGSRIHGWSPVTTQPSG